MTKIPDINNIENWTPNDYADYYRYHDGANDIPAITNTENRDDRCTWIKWKELGYQTGPIPENQHEQWKKDNAFKNGMAIISGRAWNAEDPDKRNLYIILVDFDNTKAIEEFCTRDGIVTPLNEVAKKMRIEQYDYQPNKCHLIFYATYPFRKKGSDKNNPILSPKQNANEIPAMEIKGDGTGVMFVTPSPDFKGNKRKIIGTMDVILCDAFEQHFDNILNKHGIPYLTNNGNAIDDNKTPIEELFSEDTRIYEGHNRHEAFLRVSESLIKRNRKIMSLDEIKKLAEAWNQKHCIPPLEQNQVDKQWNDALKFIERSDAEKASGIQEWSELTGNIYYQINEKPPKYIVAYRQKNQVIEVTIKSEPNKYADNPLSLRKYIVHNKTYLACNPVKIIRHKNPLTFLQLQETFTIQFVDATGEHYTFSHKTLSAIIQSLKERALVFS